MFQVVSLVMLVAFCLKHDCSLQPVIFLVHNQQLDAAL